ncbi:GntR family transcriptional regulator [Nocardia sp. CDC186]|uniref:GntR family transcriptional regulator n=1 Tax=Nocardia implantans TaxID=3108168 RepID=A0ABU6AY59_9NOCA|nr:MULTISPECIES: GntR family transcriptional regulator [unclassified Nocardia]MBF6190555.1 GntR family transcriptional regulator [Nocardia beijingensis]MEA3528468.1 GntR family transcriptional regulator [Nocardia sp. CDC192]MEB3512380.1 GntR family transcriptional regulator [Nocardia sp. CDC186]
MAEPAYVKIAGEYARKIRAGELPPGTQLRSYPELAKRHGVSQIVIRNAIELLLGQGLVRTERRKGTFVADRPNLTRVSPERQFEQPETTFENEASEPVEVERDIESVSATEDLADKLGVKVGAELTHVIVRASEGGRPISVSDSYQPVGVADVSAAAFLEETITDSLPPASHAEWLKTPSGELVKAVFQRYIDSDEQVLMISNISYPRDRYDAFLFRMALEPESVATSRRETST